MADNELQMRFGGDDKAVLAALKQRDTEIERLRADNERLRTAAKAVLGHQHTNEHLRVIINLREALGQKENPETTSPFPEFEDSMPGLAESIRKDKE